MCGGFIGNVVGKPVRKVFHQAGGVIRNPSRKLLSKNLRESSGFRNIARPIIKETTAAGLGFLGGGPVGAALAAGEVAATGGLTNNAFRPLPNIAAPAAVGLATGAVLGEGLGGQIVGGAGGAGGAGTGGAAAGGAGSGAGTGGTVASGGAGAAGAGLGGTGATAAETAAQLSAAGVTGTEASQIIAGQTLANAVGAGTISEATGAALGNVIASTPFLSGGIQAIASSPAALTAAATIAKIGSSVGPTLKAVATFGPGALQALQGVTGLQASNAEKQLAQSAFVAAQNGNAEALANALSALQASLNRRRSASLAGFASSGFLTRTGGGAFLDLVDSQINSDKKLNERFLRTASANTLLQFKQQFDKANLIAGKNRAEAIGNIARGGLTTIGNFIQ